MLAVALAIGPAVGSSPDALAATNGVLPGEGFYPRVVRPAHAGADDGTILATTNAGGVGTIWRSTDDGASFAALTTISPGPDAVFLCCIALWEAPSSIGPWPAGTLLWSGSVGTDMGTPKHMALRVWRSDDHGSTWIPLAPCATSTGGGLWEPDFHVANDGSLVCDYSDETDQPAHSQVLSQVVSHDGGQTWGPPTQIVAAPKTWHRPGMPTTAKLPDGSWVMTYEVCGSFPSCHVELRRSTDGLDWGDPATAGERVLDPDGGYLAHTPVVTWTPAGGGDGTLVLSGQLLFGPDHALAPGNGRTLLVNPSSGQGRWTRIDAPVAVVDPTDNFCPNYSSPVIDLDGNGRLLELASFWDGPTCRTAFGTARAQLGPVPPTTASTTSTTSSPSSSSTSSTSTSSTEPGSPPTATPVSAVPAYAG